MTRNDIGPRHEHAPISVPSEGSLRDQATLTRILMSANDSPTPRILSIRVVTF